MARVAPLNRKPEFEEFLKVLRGEVPCRPTLGEMFVGWTALQQAAGFELNKADPLGVIRLYVAGHLNLGYDYAVMTLGNFGFPQGDRPRDSSISLNEGALITDRATFAAYSWPSPDETDRPADATLQSLLPAGMKFIIRGPGGILENVINLVGFDNLCLLLADDPALVREIVGAVGSRMLRYYELAADYDSVGAILSNDDWGFKTQTMLAPDQLRQYVFPWHQRIVAAAHKVGKPVILHSCGNLIEVFDDIIEDMKYDGKHSYEDAIMPVEEAYERWGGRIAIIGGIDVDFLTRSTPAAIFSRAEALLARSAQHGGYALGSGNSIPDYVPMENYHAMIRAAWD